MQRPQRKPPNDGRRQISSAISSCSEGVRRTHAWRTPDWRPRPPERDRRRRRAWGSAEPSAGGRCDRLGAGPGGTMARVRAPRSSGGSRRASARPASCTRMSVGSSTSVTGTAANASTPKRRSRGGHAQRRGRGHHPRRHPGVPAQLPSAEALESACLGLHHVVTGRLSVPAVRPATRDSAEPAVPWPGRPRRAPCSRRRQGRRPHRGSGSGT